jgi:hypothetical protein
MRLKTKKCDSLSIKLPNTFFRGEIQNLGVNSVALNEVKNQSSRKIKGIGRIFKRTKDACKSLKLR